MRQNLTKEIHHESTKLRKHEKEKWNTVGTEAGPTIAAGTWPETPYETTPNWHSFFFDLTGHFFAGDWIGFEYRISNKKYRIMKCGIASL